MQALFLVLHVLVGIGLITLILLQHGKGADAGAAFGSGASATVFGARGSATFLTKATAVLAILFFSNSFFLNYLFANTTGPKSVIEEKKEGNAPTEIIENTIAPIEEKESEPPAEPPQSDLPALPRGSGRGVTGSDVPPAPVSPSPGSQGSASPSPEAPAPESPAGESRSAAPNAPAADTPEDAPAVGEGEAGATPKPVEGVESKSAQPAESGPTAGPDAEPSAEPTPEAASPKSTEPPSTAAGKEPSAAAKPPATAPKVPAKKTQTTKRTPEPKTTKRQPSTGKSTSSTDKKKEEDKTP